MLLQFGALGVTMSWDDDFLPLGGYLFSLGVFLRGPSRTPFRVFSNPLESLRGPPSRPLAEPSRASSNPLVALRRSSWPFVDFFFWPLWITLNGFMQVVRERAASPKPR